MAPGKAVLVTRPAGRASEGLCRALAASGYRSVSQPLLALRPLAPLPPPDRTVVQALDSYQHVIFISANAVAFGMVEIDRYWPQLPVGLNWYGIGEATAAELANWDINAITPGQHMTSEGLLAVPQLQQVAGDRVLIVKGVGGRGKLREQLVARGAKVDLLPCYERYCPALPAGALAALIAAHDVGTVLLGSGDTLANMLELLSRGETSNLAELCLVVPSERVATMARDAGFERVVVAANASDAAMVEALGRMQR